jgi:hypothetical protein
MIEKGALLPPGVIVGSAVIAKVSQVDFHSKRIRAGDVPMAIADVERARKFRKPKGHPQPVWFKPF